MIAFVTALREEREAVRRSWGLSKAGTLSGFELESGPDCIHLCSGMGAPRLLQAVDLLKKAYAPSLFVLVGYSVGLKAELRVGDLMCDLRSDASLVASLAALCPHMKLGSVSTCGFLHTSSQKLAHAEKHPDALVADLESEAFIASLKPPTRFLVVRAVSDEVFSDLPLNFGELADKKGFPDVKAIGLKLATRPHLLPKLLKLGRDAGVATRALTNLLSQSRDLFRETL